MHPCLSPIDTSNQSVDSSDTVKFNRTFHFVIYSAFKILMKLPLIPIDSSLRHKNVLSTQPKICQLICV